MTNCIGEMDLKEVARETLADFDREIAELAPELCLPFNQAARQLEGELLTIYRFVVRLVRREDDLDKIASWWGTLVSQCDEFAKRLHQLSLAHPECGATFFYDRVLDLRNKCQRLQTMHDERAQ
jgi:hypothetical protein